MDAAAVTREHKLALIVGFSLILVVSVLVSDHLSGARTAQLAPEDPLLQASVTPTVPATPLLAGRGALPPAPMEPSMRIASAGSSAGSSAEPVPGGAAGTAAGESAATDLGSVGTGADRRASTLAQAFSPADRGSELPEIPGFTRIDEGEAPRLVEVPVATANTPGAPGSQGLVGQGPVDVIVTGPTRPAALAGGGDGRSALERRLGVKIGDVPTLVQAVDKSSRSAGGVSPGGSVAGAALPAAAEYHVRAGDSLTSIAQKMLGRGDRWPEIAELNKDRLPDRNSLRVGLRLRMPGGTAAVAAAEPVAAKQPPVPTRTPAPTPKTGAAKNATATAGAGTPTAAPGATRKYVVQRGDTLTGISQKMLGSAKRMGEILALNKGRVDDANDILVGMSIVLPAK